MEFQHPISANIFFLLLIVVAMNFPENLAPNPDRVHNVTDRLALLQFKHHIYDDPYGVLNSWNHSQHHCQWSGVTCGTRHQRVTALILTGTRLSGIISPHMGNLSFIKFIHLGDNQFHGEIPQEIGSLFRLRSLTLSKNSLSGEIPVNLSRCSQITNIDLYSNKLVGKIAIELSNLKSLEILRLSLNNLTGEIPSSIGNLSSLTELILSENNLEGNLPKEMGFLTRLTIIGVGQNKLYGMLPDFIFNISSLVGIAVAVNNFHGILPTKIGLALPNLQLLHLGGNNLSGNIPISITNASRLRVLDLPLNNFKGRVPNNLGDLSNLKRLSLHDNFLGSNSVGDLGFIASLINCSNLIIIDLGGNNFGDELPGALANLTNQLTELALGENKISGTIPQGLGNFDNLYAFDVTDNFLSGMIPNDFGELHNLQYLGLTTNKLSGEVLSILKNITPLYFVDLSHNRFEENISGNLGIYQNLQFLDLSQNNFKGIISPQIFGTHMPLTYIDLSHNSLSGALPFEVGKLIQLEVINVSFNKFSGEIPSSLVDCTALRHVYMQANFFHGAIPSNLASLKSIEQLDLSSNNLSGQIPRNLDELQSIVYLNLSYNDLEGEVPTTTGIFANATGLILIGNEKLCGGIPELHLPSCLSVKSRKKSKIKLTMVLSTVLALTILALGIILLSMIYQKRYRIKAVLSNVPMSVHKLLRISYNELHRATAGFSQENLIGSGSFGFVYQGRLEQHGGKLVAVKVLDLQKNGASKSFKAECRALRNIRHRNLVSLLTYCSSIDSKGQEFKALVYEYMVNGNLDLWLHPVTTNQTTKSRKLNLLQRLNIAIDVASALHYLHHQCEESIVHCDIKPSNILLDNDLVAHVGDFGLARLLSKTTNVNLEQGNSSTIAIKGSIGYAAPEYGLGIQVSIEGDVYSYGILLLEMFIGKRPTDDIFMDGLDLHKYVEKAFPDQVFKIVDPLLLLSEGDEIGEMVAQVELNNDDQKKMECMISILKIGVKCSAELPNNRMQMNEIVTKLHLIKDCFVGARVNREDLDI